VAIRAEDEVSCSIYTVLSLLLLATLTAEQCFVHRRSRHLAYRLAFLAVVMVYRSCRVSLMFELSNAALYKQIKVLPDYDVIMLEQGDRELALCRKSTVVYGATIHMPYDARTG
jgi:hypothetical protein